MNVRVVILHTNVHKQVLVEHQHVRACLDNPVVIETAGHNQFVVALTHSVDVVGVFGHVEQLDATVSEELVELVHLSVRAKVYVNDVLILHTVQYALLHGGEVCFVDQVKVCVLNHKRYIHLLLGIWIKKLKRMTGVKFHITFKQITMVSVANPFDMLSALNKPSQKEKTYIQAKVSVYLPQSYVPLIVKILENTKNNSITLLGYDRHTNDIRFQATNMRDLIGFRKCLNDILENTFLVYLENEYGNIGDWADVE